MADVTVDGTWLKALGHVAGVKWSTRWGPGPCGSDLASCTVVVSTTNDASLLRLARTLEVSEGVVAFGGVISEIGRALPRSLNARGWARRAADFEAVDSAGAPTTNPREAVTQAIADGLPWTNPNAFDNVSLGTDGGPTAQRLDALLDNWAITVGKRWGTDVYGAAFAEVDPTAPTWFLDAADLDLGVADDGLFTAVRARYVNSVDGDGNPDGWDVEEVEDATGIAEFGSIWYAMDLTPLGLISGVTAAAYAQSQLDLLTVPQWLSRIVTTGSRLRTAGDLPAHLPSVRAGQMVRLFNVPNSLGGLRGQLGLDVVLGEVEYDTANPMQITLAPVGLAVRNLADALAASKKAAA